MKNFKLRVLSMLLATVMVLAMVPFGVFAQDTQSENGGEPALPNAEVKNLGYVTVEKGEEASSSCFGDSYYTYDLINGGGLSSDDKEFDLQIAMEFVAKDTLEEAQANYYGDYTTDFFITIEGLAEGSFVGDGCYLAGYYPSFGAWVTIPLDNFSIENGKVYPVITSAGFDFKYVDICDAVQDFVCGIYLSDEVLTANPDLTVTLALGLSENFEKAQAAEYTRVGSYTYTVLDMTAVAQIGNTKYTDFGAAVAAWNDGATLTLLRNVELTDTLTIPAGKAVTLDLNGRTISQKKAQTGAYAMIANKGDLTVKDSVGTGKVSYADITEYTADVGYASNTIRNEGVLTIAGGTVENVSSDNVANYGYPHAIDAYQGSVTNITGGTVKSANYDSIRMFCNSTIEATTVNISGGTIVNRVSFQAPTSNKADYGVLNITGGNFVTTAGVSANVRLLVFSTDLSQMKATISGGTFDKGVAISNFSGANVTWTPITGGTFGTDVSAYLADGYTLVANADGTYTVVSANAVVVPEDVTDAIVDAIVGEGASEAEKEAVKEVVDAIVEDLVANEALSGDYAPTGVPADAELVVKLADIVLDEKKEAPTKLVFDVAPMNAQGKVETTQPITFRLPLPSSVTEAYANVYHEGEHIGLYIIKEENGAKYVEVSSADFSKFAVEPTNEKVSNVAEVNGVGYATLAEAIANADGKTVTLLADITLTEGVVIEAGKTVTIDLNGKTISGEYAGNESYGLITNEGTLTITDSAEGGKIAFTYTGTANSTGVAMDTIRNKGVLTITGGTISNTATLATAQVGYAIDMYSGSSLTVTGGTITASGSNYYDGIRLVAGSTTKDISVTVTGGTVSTIWMQNPSANKATDLKANLTISGGKVSAVWLDPSADFEVSISGGEIGKVAMNAIDSTNTDRNPSGFITGGTFTTLPSEDMLDEGLVFAENADGSYGVAADPTHGKVAKIGDTYYATLAEAFAAATNGQTVKLLTDIVIDTETYTIKDGVSITFDMNGKKLTVTDNRDLRTCYELFYIYGELTVKGNGTIELTATNNDTNWAKSSGIFHNRGGVLNLMNGTFTHKGGTGMAFVVDNSGNWYGDATTNIYDGATLTSSYIAIRNRMEENSHGASGTAYLNIYGGTINGTSRAIWGQASSSSTTAPARGLIKVLGGTIGLIDTARNAGAESMIVISGGTVASVKCEVGELTVTDSDAITGEVTILTASGAAASYTVTEDGRYIAAVAKVGNTYYETLAEAFAAGGEITLLCNVALTAPLTVEKGKTVVLDLAGFKITYDSAVQGEAMITNKGTLTINDSVGGGEIYYDIADVTADPSYGKGNYTIDNAGTLTLNGGKVHIANLSTHAKYPINNNSTTGDAIFVMNGGSLYNYNTSAIRQFCNSTVYKNSVTINGGLIEGYSAIWVQNPASNTVNATLAITGGEVKTTAKAYVNGTADLSEVGSGIYFTINGKGGSWSADSAVSITGGIINENVKLSADTPAAIEIDEENATFNGNLELPENYYVAQVGDEKYATLAEAIANADGKTVTLLADITLTEGVVIEAGKTVTIDLNGKIVSMETAEDAKYYLVLNKGNLTIVDSSAEKTGKLSYHYTGTDQSDAHNTIESAPASTLIVKSGTIENLSANCLIAYAIDGVTNGGLGDVAVTIEGGTITSKKIAVRIFANSTTCTGTLTITDGTIIGRVIVQSSNANANKAALAITGGTFTSNGYKTDVLYIGGSNGAGMEIAVAISGGAFEGELLNASSETGFITGGTFTTLPSEDMLDEGLVFAENADGSYGVAPDPTHGKAAQVGDNCYNSLDEALLAATSGQTVKLLADATVATLILGEGVTLDLNGFKLTATYVASFGTITDTSKMAGKIIVAKTRIHLNADNAAMPIWDVDGYRFAVMNMQGKRLDDGSDETMFSVEFRPTVGDTDLNVQYFADGMENNGLKLEIHLEWMDGEIAKDENIYVPESVLQNIYLNSRMITYTVTGIAQTVANVRVSIVLISETGVQISQTIISAQAANS